MAGLVWRPAVPERDGVINISREVPRTGGEPDTVLARTILNVEQARRLPLRLGYSDQVRVYLNRRLLFEGDSSYRSRDPSFLGLVGLFDTVILPLESGSNELVLMVTESFGGWGFVAADGEAELVDASLSPLWRSPRRLRIPESVVYDPDRDVLYVSNYDGYNPSRGEGRQSVARLTLGGEILDPEWVGGLFNPTGMAMVGGRLFVVERTGLAEIDPELGEIVARHAAPAPGFLNDVAADHLGRLYVTDSVTARILRFADGRFEEYLAGEIIGDPNGVAVQGQRLIVGSNADRCLKAVDLESRQVQVVACFAEGVIDGIRPVRDGSLLVSHWQGRLYRIAPDGEVIRLLDSSTSGTRLADFDVVEDHDLLVLPTFDGNSVIGYSCRGLR
jgi:sugar lactone lactonase YvrE